LKEPIRRASNFDAEKKEWNHSPPEGNLLNPERRKGTSPRKEGGRGGFSRKAPNKGERLKGYAFWIKATERAKPLQGSRIDIGEKPDVISPDLDARKRTQGNSRRVLVEARQSTKKVEKRQIKGEARSA